MPDPSIAPRPSERQGDAVAAAKREAMDTRWRIELLGRLRARRGDHEVAHFPRQKAGALLAYLAYYPRHPHPREALMELLWPETDLELGRQYFRNALHALREQLAPGDSSETPLLLTDRTSVGLRPGMFRTDVGEFTAALAAARAAPAGEQAAHLAAAAAAYSGALLPDSFESWVLMEREALQGQYLEVLHQWVAALEAAGDLAGALERARQAVTADPLREESHYDLMRLYAATGQPSACVRQYQELERILREELDETPSAEARALAEELRVSARTLVVARRPLLRRVGTGPGEDGETGRPGDKTTERTAAPPLPSPGPPVAPPPSLALPAAPRLPLQLTRFFGREAEIARLTELLGRAVSGRPSVVSPIEAAFNLADGRWPTADSSRLVTLTGPGGSGKTRLAIAAAGRLREGFGAGEPPTQGVPGGSFAFVALADVTDASLLVEAIADSLELERSAGAEGVPAKRVLTQIVERLRERPWLLVLDNFEHLVETGAPLVSRLLEQIPTLTCLVTSRRSLGVSGEQEFALLPLPTPRRSDSLEQLRDCPSVQLFVDRARAVKADFQLTEANAAAVGELCDQLEGLPLALELAAARAGILAPRQILEHVGGRFEFLVNRQRDVPARHRTLRAAIDSSFQLLSPDLQRFFARLSVFRGGWTLEAAAAILDFGLPILDLNPPSDETPIQNPKSKIQNALDCLQQLRDCSLIQVEERGGEVRYRLLETLREYAGEQLAASGELAEIQKRHRDWYLQLAAEAEAVAVGPGLAEGPARLEAELDNFRVVLAWCRQEAEADPNGDAAEAGLRLASALWWTWMQRGYLAEASESLEGALARGSSLPPSLRAPALFRAGYLARDRGDQDRWRTLLRAARREYGQALTLARQEGDRREVARTLISLADVTARDGDWDAAWSLCMEARPLFEALGEPRGLAGTLEWLARIAVSRGDRQAARPLLEERLAICRKLGESEPLIHALGGLGHLERDEGDYDRARTLYQESLRLRWKLGHQMALAMSLEDFAVLAEREGRAERAVRLLGAAEAFCETLGARPPVADDTDYERTVAEGRAALGAAAFAAAWAEGRALTLEEAVCVALEEEECDTKSHERSAETTA